MEEQGGWILIDDAAVGARDNADALRARRGPSRQTSSTTARVEPSLACEGWVLVERPRAASGSGGGGGGAGALPHEGGLAPAAVADESWDSAIKVSVEPPCFVHVPATAATLARGLARRQPAVVGAALWGWLLLLVAGEMATTVWWLSSLGWHGLLSILAPALLAPALMLMLMRLEQVVASCAALAVAALPALPAYSAVLLMVPSGGGPLAPHTGWELVHWPALVALGTLHLAAALLPALRAEHPAPGRGVRGALRVLEVAEEAARSACIIAGWIYAAALLHFGASHLSGWVSATHGQGLGVEVGSATPAATAPQPGGAAAPANAWMGGGSLVLALHAMGLLCAEARRRTMDALGDDLLPLLLGAERAQALTVRALVVQHGGMLLRRAPALRRCAPPPHLVALVVAVRRTAPALFPALALASQLAGLAGGGLGLPLLANLAPIALTAASAARELRKVPSSELRRLPLLLPSGVAPGTRRMLGHVLVAAERVEGARARLASSWLGRHQPPQRR